MDKFIKKNTVEEIEDNELAFSDDELISIYNSLGYTMTNVSMLNGLLQDKIVLFLIEEHKHYLDSIRYKIESELSRRSFEN